MTAPKILVTYASKYGSTREVAESIAGVLGEHGLEVDVIPADDVSGLDGYSAVVLGSSLYFFMVHSAAKRFLRRYGTALEKLPFAVFGMGPIEDTPEQFEGARQNLDKTLEKHAELKPVAVAVFGGKVTPSGLRFPDNNPAFRKMGATDIRDWDAIRTWAESLPPAFGIAAD